MMISIGDKFGEWEVISKTTSDKNRNTKWLCKCSCGKIKSVYGYHLRKGNTLSCGCKNYKNLKPQIKHNMTGTRIYGIWTHMRARCYNPKSQKYEDYGGRGIDICKGWDDFEIFYKWAIENGYKRNLTIDRIDNNKGYYPNNSRWATRKTQANNTRSNVKIVINGVEKTLKQWSEYANINYSTLYARYKNGWVGEDLISASRIIEMGGEGDD
jgi:hypothetical protein